jgi:hypothetical protein
MEPISMVGTTGKKDSLSAVMWTQSIDIFGTILMDVKRRITLVQ